MPDSKSKQTWTQTRTRTRTLRFSARRGKYDCSQSQSEILLLKRSWLYGQVLGIRSKGSGFADVDKKKTQTKTPVSNPGTPQGSAQIRQAICDECRHRARDTTMIAGDCCFWQYCRSTPVFWSRDGTEVVDDRGHGNANAELGFGVYGPEVDLEVLLARFVLDRRNDSHALGYQASRCSMCQFLPT